MGSEDVVKVLKGSRGLGLLPTSKLRLGNALHQFGWQGFKFGHGRALHVICDSWGAAANGVLSVTRY